MYEPKLKRTFKGAKVRELIAVLQTMPPDAQILCDGDEWFWLHVEKERSVVNIDSTELEDEYEVKMEGNPQNYEDRRRRWKQRRRESEER